MSAKKMRAGGARFPSDPSDDHVYYYLGERLKLERGAEDTVWALERRERREKPESCGAERDVVFQ